MSFVSVLKAAGKEFAKGLKYAVVYAVPVEKLVAILFPAAGPIAGSIATATTLVQNAVLLVEQKYAAAGVQGGTGPQKLAEVLTLASSAVTTLLAQAGVAATPEYVEALVSAVVGILNVQPATQATAVVAPSATAVAAH